MKISSIVIILFYLFVAVPVWADPHGFVSYGGRVNYRQQSGYASGSGGEFTIYSAGSPGLLLSNSAYSSKTRDVYSVGSFQTFCVEKDEYINPNPSDIWVSHSAVDESTGIPGSNGSGSHTFRGGANTNLGDNLDPLTAYLYTQFAKGILSNYDYDPLGVRTSDAAQLQRAFWNLEGELTLKNDGSDDKAKAWVQEANTEVTMAGGSWYDTWGSGSIGNVRILQFCNSDGTGYKQDQLYLVPVPGAFLLGILGLGTVGLKLRKFT